MKDTYGRTIDYMRISITDRCNLRCRYCMPDGVELVPMSDILTFEEIVRIAAAAAEAGIRKFKVTGGEPLVRLGCPDLVGELKQIPGVEQVTLTTNGVLLSKYLEPLAAAGLDGVNIRTEVPDVFAESGRGLYIIRCFGEIEPAEEGGLTVCIKRHI